MAIDSKETGEERSAGDIAADFIKNNRKAILAFFIVVAAGVIGFIAFSAVKDILEKKAVEKVGGYARRLEEISDLAAESAETDALLEELAAFAPKSFGYAAGKAYALAAEIYAARKDWDKAEEAWLAAAKKSSGIFLAPVSLYNAAVAAEERGELDKSVEYHEQCAAFEGINPAAARSQFSIGRIREQQNNREAAVAAYRKVLEKWGDDTNWSNLARSRIISLEGKE